MYYADLTSYEYSDDGSSSANCLNVGWLDEKHHFQTGVSPEEFKTQLFNLCSKSVNGMRGYHSCPLCNEGLWGIEAVRDNKSLILGSAEIRVSGDDGRIYAGPNLIYHYVNDHSYLPPQEFIDAVLRGKKS